MTSSLPNMRWAILPETSTRSFAGVGNPHGIAASAHSVLTRDLVDEAGHPTRAALDRVLGFFRERLADA